MLINTMSRSKIVGALLLAIASLFVAHDAAAQDAPRLEVELDVSQVEDDPQLVQWGQDAQSLITEWHPRLCNLLQSPEFEPPNQIRLVIQASEDGVGHTRGTTIVISSKWIQDHPEDVGLIIHELTHVIQNYRRRVPGWVTEGIADYIRWAIYEGKPQHWFRPPDKAHGYRDGYRVAAGFFLWLEGEKAPGIVSRLNTAARGGEYHDALFEDTSGQTLDELWEEYRAR